MQVRVNESEGIQRCCRDIGPFGYAWVIDLGRTPTFTAEVYVYISRLVMDERLLEATRIRIRDFMEVETYIDLIRHIHKKLAASSSLTGIVFSVNSPIQLLTSCPGDHSTLL